MIHGMNAMQELDPPYRASENKTIRAAKQLLAANPSQQQLYTIQSDLTRNIYNSGEWFNANPQCTSATCTRVPRGNEGGAKLYVLC